MTDWLADLLDGLLGLPRPTLYAVLGVAAALENLLPPIPADVTVLFGGWLAGRGVIHLPTVFLVVWLANVAGALAVYWLGRRYGAGFFRNRWGRRLLRPEQLRQLQRFYHRWGIVVVFLSRFVPMFRAVVPVFAGVARLRPLTTALAIAPASALWYGVIVYTGAAAGSNWAALVALLDRATLWLWVLAVPAGLAVALWWRRTR